MLEGSGNLGGVTPREDAGFEIERVTLPGHHIGPISAMGLVFGQRKLPTWLAADWLFCQSSILPLGVAVRAERSWRAIQGPKNSISLKSSELASKEYGNGGPHPLV